jgi:hypothetical protein
MEDFALVETKDVRLNAEGRTYDAINVALVPTQVAEEILSRPVGARPAKWEDAKILHKGLPATFRYKVVDNQLQLIDKLPESGKEPKSPKFTPAVS